MTCARQLARLASRHEPDEDGKRHFVVCSGGGPSIMEAANRGAVDEGKESIGLNIVLPHEQMPNPYVTPGLSFQFHYFALRKMHFLLRARAVAVFPGGFGTFDEAFELLTLIQTGKVKPIPILFFGRAFWERVINFEALAEEGVISQTTSSSSLIARAPRKPGTMSAAIMRTARTEAAEARGRANHSPSFQRKLESHWS